MKKVAVIGSPKVHKNYQSALEKAGGSAVIFPDSAYIKKHPDSFDGLLLPGGGDVLSSLAEYTSLFKDSSDLYCYTQSTPLFFEYFNQKLPNPHTNSADNCEQQFFDTYNTLSEDTRLTLEQLSALNMFYKMEKPIFGICKGMQLINLYFRGTIGEVSNVRLHQSPEKDTFHPAENLPGNFLHALFGPHIIINSNHHQCIHSCGQNLQIIQRASDGTAEAVSHLTAPVFGTQWHPERMPKLHHQDAGLLFRYFISLL